LKLVDERRSVTASILDLECRQSAVILEFGQIRPLNSVPFIETGRTLQKSVQQGHGRSTSLAALGECHEKSLLRLDGFKETT
jgi:hypothetical protein